MWGDKTVPTMSFFCCPAISILSKTSARPWIFSWPDRTHIQSLIHNINFLVMETLCMSSFDKSTSAIRRILTCMFVFGFIPFISATPDDWMEQLLYRDVTPWNSFQDAIIPSGDHTTEVALSCIPELNVSLGQEGYAVLTPMMLLTHLELPANMYTVDIMGPLTNTVYCAQLGQELMVSVFEIPTGNSCMSMVFVEDKLRPELTCTPDILPCNVDINEIDFELYLDDVDDNCDPDPDVWYSYVIQNLPCNPNGYTQQILVTWTATDDSGNSATCQDIIYLQKPPIGAIVFPADISISCEDPDIDPSNTGEPTYNGDPIGHTCQYSVWYSDAVVPMCDGAQKIKRTWTVMDWCTSAQRTEIQFIFIIDDVPPTIVCPPSITINAGSINCNASYTLPTPTVDDACADPSDIDIDITIAGIPGIFAPGQVVLLGLGTKLITMRATDPCGNSSMCQYTVTVKDNNGPIINCPADITVSCNGSTLPAATGTATAYDICDATPTITYTDVTTSSSNNCAFGYRIIRTWKAQDDSGNTACCTQTIDFTDDVPPVITCPSNVSIECTESTLPANTGSATATDVCDLTPTITFTDATIAGSCPQERIINRTWRATDDCNNSSTCIQVISVQDNTAPIVTCPDDITVMCADGTLPANTGTATATDNCDATPTITFADVTTAGGGPQQFNVNRTWIATDDCGNSGTCLQIIVVFDETPPVITCPSNITISCTAGTLPPGTGTATATDNCDDSPLITFIDITAGGPCPQEGTITRTWTAADDCGNASTCVQLITIDDSAGPAITCPANITIQCTESTLPANTGTATATDNCDPSPTVTSADVTIGGNCPQERTINRTWSATDDCGNVTTCLQVIFVDDSQAPIITCPANLTINCNESTLPANTGTATATDNCDNLLGIVFADVIAGGGCPQEFTITRTWSANDDCINISTCIQIITVQDNAAPVITCPGDITIDCSESTDPANTGSATASDVCDASVTITFADVTIAGGGCILGININRTWTAVDDCGNSSTCLQFIEVSDEAAPLITCPANVTISCSESTLPANTGTATATDNCDATPAITFSDAVAGGNCPEEMTITRTWTATDDCGNATSCIQLIVVDDSAAPAITCPPDVTVDCNESTLPANTGTATATDNCDPFPGIQSFDVVSGSGCNLIITRTWQANDDCLNTSTCVQIITVQDESAPAIFCPLNTTIDCAASTAPGNTGMATASDACDASVAVTFSDVTVGNCPQDYTINRTWTGTDDCGNASTCLQVIVVDDTTAPICSAQDITVSLNGSMVIITGAQVNDGSTDNCNPITFSVAPNSFDCDDVGDNPVVLTVTDCAGNSSTCTAIVTIEDTGGLVANCQDITVFVDASGNVIVDPIQVDNGSGDGCGGLLEYDLSQTNFNCTNLGPNIVILTVTDEDGNTATCTAIITVVDNMPPDITCPADLTVDCHTVTNPENTGQFGDATATDNCPPAFISETHVINLNDCNVGTIVRTFTASDASGNIATCIQVVTVTNPNPLDESDIDWPASPINVNICNSTDPEDIPGGEPVIDPNALICADVDISYSDQVVTNIDNNPATPCMVITRTWTVVDNCQPNGTFVFVQTINVQDMAPPVFTNINDMTKVANANCVAFFTLIASATDCAGVTITNNSPYGATTGANASGNYPIGVTVVIFTATDGCGNTSTMDVVITVTDPDPTDFMCEKVIFILPEETEIDIAAEAFITFIEGNCTSADDFIISYSNTNPYDTVRTYDCGDVGVTTFSLWFWTADGTMIVDSCATADLDLRDPNDYCMDGLIVVGEVRSEAGFPIPNAQVSVMNAAMIPDTTDNNGKYQINGLAKWTGYTIAPFHDWHHRAGVSTLDLVMIQKHLLGIAKLNSPYKMIAADANKSGHITVMDMLEIRRLILGMTNRFPNNTSWRFIDYFHEFADPYNPFNPGFPESTWLDSITHGMDTANFVGVKIGDVNGSYFNGLSGGAKIEPRSGESYQLTMGEARQEAGDKWELIADPSQGAIDGMQFSLMVGPYSASQASEISSAIIPADNWYYDAASMSIKVSWSPGAAVDVSGKTLFTGPIADWSLDQYWLDERVIQPEAYIADGELVQIREVKFQLAGTTKPEIADEYQLFQNIPNPFTEGTIIRFSLPKPEAVTLLVHDVAGRIVIVKETNCPAGLNEIQLRNHDLTSSGIYYYTLQTANASLTRKMSYTSN